MAEITKVTKSKRTKEYIVLQALALFQQSGYETVTMREIAKACDLSLGAFYYHFKKKEEIVLELFKSSLAGHHERTILHLQTCKPQLEAVMTWICRDRFAEFEAYRDVVRVLVQRLDPEDPVSPWHPSSESIREDSITLFESVVSHCLPKLSAKLKRQLARALWLQQLLILAAWSFDRSDDQKHSEKVLKQSRLLWEKLPSLLRVPGVESLIGLALSPLELLERSTV